MQQGQGAYINGQFMSGSTVISSENPARDFERVFETSTDSSLIEPAISAAQKAYDAWRVLSMAERFTHLERLRKIFIKRHDELAKAVVTETGKPLREAEAEAKSCANRITLVAEKGIERIRESVLDNGTGNERPHPQGVVLVLGPFNFPLHLMNGHIIPALLTGNTVILKPSEQTPMCADIYAQCFAEAEFPPGVFNMVQGAGDIGATLSAHPAIDAVLFTGSYQTGQRILSANLEQPHKLIALEMGGKNTAMVMDDAHLEQAISAICHGAFLTTGQRCTATSRVLVHQSIAEPLIKRLVEVSGRLKPQDPFEPLAPFGPLANRATFERFNQLRSNIQGAQTLLKGQTLEGGAFVTPSIHLLEDPMTAAAYLDTELFGPDICVEIFADIDDGLSRLNRSQYGLSNSIFTRSEETYEHVFHASKSGLLNWNKSTNGASGELPFGGVGRSGNQRPAGIDAVRYTTYPVSGLHVEYGVPEHSAAVASALASPDGKREKKTKQTCTLNQLILRHDIEALFEKYRIFADDVSGPNLFYKRSAFQAFLPLGKNIEQTNFYQTAGFMVDNEADAPSRQMFRITALDIEAIRRSAFLEPLETALKALIANKPERSLSRSHNGVQTPKNGSMPRSAKMLSRMYANDFVPKERKTPVVDLASSYGPYIASVDDTPLVLLDAASQIASLGLGFNADEFRKAYDRGELDQWLLSNSDVGESICEAFRQELVQHTWDDLKHISFTAGGSEANEKAFDLCRVNGPGGKRIIAFEGSFHGRTMMSIHATYNPIKRAPFEFKGYEVSYVPFPAWKDPRHEPVVTDDWVRAWSQGESPALTGDPLCDLEIQALQAVDVSIRQGDMCAVLVEPMQGEGGDNYATARFFNGLRALTRHHGVPLIFDEVQMGFGMGGPFFWHALFNLRDQHGAIDGPDCVTLAKRAQTGACLSVWEDTRPSRPHYLQVARGLIHAQAISEFDWTSLERDVTRRLVRLAESYPRLISDIRNKGGAFAFDLPTKHAAMQFVSQRFYRGMMVYIAGERTIRFRLTKSWTRDHLNTLFQSIGDAVAALVKPVDVRLNQYDLKETNAKPWINTAHVSAKKVASSQSVLAEMLSLAGPSLERTCDLYLARHGQLESRFLTHGLSKLFPERDTAKVTPHEIVEMIRVRALKDGALDLNQYTTLMAAIGMPPERLLAESCGTRIIRFDHSAWNHFKDDIVSIEQGAYEPGRQDSPAELQQMIQQKGIQTHCAIRRSSNGPHLLGYAIGGPAHLFSADGPRDDWSNDMGTTFYTANITLRPEVHGAQIGFRLKAAQLKDAVSLKNNDGQPTYRFMSGRNRIDATHQIGRINQRLGAYVDTTYRGNQYGDASGAAEYYRIPLHHGERQQPKTPSNDLLRWHESVDAPLGQHATPMVSALKRGELANAVGTKLTLSNWVTPAVIRYTELLQAIAPQDLPHCYFTSGRSELIDKGIRSFRIQRPRAQKVITLTDQFFGTLTAAARSVTDGSSYQQPFAYFDWPKVDHPNRVGADAALQAIEALIKKDADDILSILVEPIGEMNGWTLDDVFLSGLNQLREKYQVPIVFCESATGLGRTGQSRWFADSCSITPNMLLFFTGGQLGHIFVDDQYFVKKPLTLISTWDGDEISAHRARYAFIATEQPEYIEHVQAFEAHCREALSNQTLSGRGMWLSIDCGESTEADRVIESCRTKGLVLKKGFGGHVIICPPISVTNKEREQGLKILQQVLS